jgi:hypothetical protein
MNIEDQEEILNVVERWELSGLLDGLPVVEKTELAQIYDNATRLMLSDMSIKKIPKNISENYENTLIPICRRLYRRVGPNFNLEAMMGDLLEVINKEGDNIFKPNPEKPASNPIIDFCVNFADNHEDALTNKTVLTTEEYENKINSIILTTKNVLLNDSIVSYVNKKDDEYIIKLSKANKNTQQTRFWNQSVAKSFLESTLSEINKGL